MPSKEDYMLSLNQWKNKNMIYWKEDSVSDPSTQLKVQHAVILVAGTYTGPRITCFISMLRNKYFHFSTETIFFTRELNVIFHVQSQNFFRNPNAWTIPLFVKV